MVVMFISPYDSTTLTSDANQAPPSSCSRRRGTRSRRYVVGDSSTLVGGGTGFRTLRDGDLRLLPIGLRDGIPGTLIHEFV